MCVAEILYSEEKCRRACIRVYKSLHKRNRNPTPRLDLKLSFFGENTPKISTCIWTVLHMNKIIDSFIHALSYILRPDICIHAYSRAKSFIHSQCLESHLSSLA